MRIRLLFLLGFFTLSCATQELLQYNTQALQSVQIKTKAYADFEIFDLRYQLRLMQLLAEYPETLQSELENYRKRRNDVLAYMQKQSQFDLDANSKYGASSRDMIVYATGMLKNANDLSTKINEFKSGSDYRMFQLELKFKPATQGQQ